jgi:hypothetical protein
MDACSGAYCSVFHQLAALPNQRMKLIVRAGCWFAGKSVTRLEWSAS